MNDISSIPAVEIATPAAPASESPLANEIRRKFLAEAGLHILSGGPAVIRPCDLYTGAENPLLRQVLLGCNIYMIVRRRRITVCPSTIRASDGLLYGHFLLHGDQPFSVERFAFSQRTYFSAASGQVFRPTDAATNSAFGHEVIAWDPQIGKASLPAHTLVCSTEHELGKAANLEVLYVGQAQGKTKDRIAIDRLLSHSTLQRILAENSNLNPQDEILILMFRFDSAKNILSTAGDFSVSPQASNEEELEHLARMSEVRLDRKVRITIAEAALINYFKPAYNVMHKNSFHSKKNKKLETLKKLLSADFTGLIVELNTESIGCKLFTKHAPARKIEDLIQADMLQRILSNPSPESKQFMKEMSHAHIARFALYDKKERETFLHSLPWGNGTAA